MWERMERRRRGRRITRLTSSDIPPSSTWTAIYTTSTFVLQDERAFFYSHYLSNIILIFCYLRGQSSLFIQSYLDILNNSPGDTLWWLSANGCTMSLDSLTREDHDAVESHGPRMPYACQGWQCDTPPTRQRLARAPSAEIRLQHKPSMSLPIHDESR